jgi:hypothetical protein
MPSEVLVVRHCALIPAANLLDAKCEVLAGQRCKSESTGMHMHVALVSINSRLLYGYVLFVV